MVLYGHPERRRWADARRYGFVSAGGGSRWSRPLQRLDIGDRVLVLVPGKGYVGSGVVTGNVRSATDAEFDVDRVERPLLSLPLESAAPGWGADDPDLAEYVVPVRWDGTVAEADGYWRKGLLSRRTTVWPFDDADQVAEVRGWLEAGGDSAGHHDDHGGRR